MAFDVESDGVKTAIALFPSNSLLFLIYGTDVFTGVPLQTFPVHIHLPSCDDDAYPAFSETSWAMLAVPFASDKTTYV